MRLVFALMLVGLATPVHAQDEGGNRLWRSAYFLGRGDTGIAVADEEEAIFYNPAGLAQGKGIYKKTVLASPHVEFSQATRDLGRRLGAEDADAVDAVLDNIGKPNHLGVSNVTAIMFRRAAIGAFTSTSLDLLAHKSEDYDALEVVEARGYQNTGATFTLAESFWSDHFRLGVTGKYLYRGRGELSASAADAEQVQETLQDQENFLGIGVGGGADVGLMVAGGGRFNPSFGLTVADVGTTQITPQEETNLDLDVKQTINAGVAIEPGTRFSKLKLLADVRDIGSSVEKNPRKKLHFGGELSVLNMVGITGGLNQGYATAGLYLNFYIIRLDAGMYTEEVGERVGTRPDTRYFVRLRLGF